jgi:hypothetical protein
MMLRIGFSTSQRDGFSKNRFVGGEPAGRDRALAARNPPAAAGGCDRRVQI